MSVTLRLTCDQPGVRPARGTRREKGQTKKKKKKKSKRKIKREKRRRKNMKKKGSKTCLTDLLGRNSVKQRLLRWKWVKANVDGAGKFEEAKLA